MVNNGEMTKDKFKDKFMQFWSNNTLSAALDNVLAMFPSTILMPIMINAAVGYELFSISAVLFLSGISTFLYLLITKLGSLPGYLGSSFAFIGVSAYIAASVSSGSPEDAAGYVFGAYIASSVLFLLLAALTKIGNSSNEKTMSVINKIIPTSVMGPAISLIGLELSGQAADQAGLAGGINSDSLLALLTIFLIVFLSVTRREFFKKSSILLGVFISGLIAVIADKWDLSPVLSAPVFKVPGFRLVIPKFSVETVMMIIPPTLILFCEHIGRKIMIENLQNGFYKNKTSNVKSKQITLFNSMSANAVANAVSVAFGGVPLTLYAENLAVMRINNDARANQFYIASLFVAILSFNGNLLELIQSIPDPILGGLSLVLMGIIAAPGIKMLVDAKVDYSKITNLFLTASVLIAGLSKMSVVIAGTEFKGMSLGMLVGIVLNALFSLLKLLNVSKEHLSFDEIKTHLSQKSGAAVTTSDGGMEVEFFISNVKFAQLSNDFDELRLLIRTDVDDDDCLIRFKSKKINGWVSLEVDGSIKNSEMKKLADRSYELACNELALLDIMADEPAADADNEPELEESRS